MVDAICIMVGSYSFVLGLTPLVQQLGLYYAWVDNPGARKIHQYPMVRVGGIAIALGIWLTLAIALQADLLTWGNPKIVGLIIGSFSFFAIGFADDLYNLSPTLRLGLQGLIGSGLWTFGIQMNWLPLPGFGAIALGWLSLPVTLIWLAGVTNAINWIDGLDGLAASIVGCIALVLVGLSWGNSDPTVWVIALAIAGATFGFLYYNAAPAKLFMGDGGAYVLGFWLAALSLLSTINHSFLLPGSSLGSSLSSSLSSGLSSSLGSNLGSSLGSNLGSHLVWPAYYPAQLYPLQTNLAYLPFVILALPIADMTRVILRRLSQGKSPFYADRGHLHHLLRDAGLSVRESVTLMASLALSTSSWAWVLMNCPQGYLGAVGSTALSAGLFSLLLLRRAWAQRPAPTSD